MINWIPPIYALATVFPVGGANSPAIEAVEITRMSTISEEIHEAALAQGLAPGQYLAAIVPIDGSDLISYTFEVYEGTLTTITVTEEYVVGCQPI